LSKKIAIALVALSMLLVLAATANSTAALTYVPGVRAGNTADYSVVGNPALPYDKTHITVWGTKGSYVALTATNYLPSGGLYSIQNHNWSIDAYGGFSNYLDAVFYWVVTANMSNGDLVLVDTAFGVYVKSNTTMTVAGASRFVLYANGSALAVDPFIMYIDRASGLIVQGNFATASGWINVTLTSTNVWSAPEVGAISGMTLVAIGEGVVIVVLIVLIAFMAFRMRAKKH
jgi:hypothetical protein